MTKADLVEKVAKEADMTKKDAEQLVEIIFDSIVQTLNGGEKIELRGFGSFRVRERNSRKGRNPKTGAAVDIPAKRVAYFKPGKELKELINEDGNSAAALGVEGSLSTSQSSFTSDETSAFGQPEGGSSGNGEPDGSQTPSVV